MDSGSAECYVRDNLAKLLRKFELVLQKIRAGTYKYKPVRYVKNFASTSWTDRVTFWQHTTGTTSCVACTRRDDMSCKTRDVRNPF